jgi:hypothetical protein
MAPRKTAAAKAVEESVEEAVVVVDEAPEVDDELAESVIEDAPLPGTPVDFGLYDAPVGVPVLDPGDAVAQRQAEAAEGDA